MLCPCWYGVKELMVLDHGFCAGTWLIRVQQGSVDGVNLDGQTFALAVDFPGPTLLDGNGTARLYMDDGASAEQRQGLEAVFQGKKGGPMAILAEFVSTWLPTLSTSIAIQEQNGALAATVGEFGQVQSQRLTNDAGQPMIMQNTGFTTALQFDNQAAQMAPSSGTTWSDPEMPRPVETNSGVVATFTWTGN
jgi:hypothetical protein